MKTIPTLPGSAKASARPLKTIVVLAGLAMCCLASVMAQPLPTNNGAATPVLPRRTPRVPPAPGTDAPTVPAGARPVGTTPSGVAQTPPNFPTIPAIPSPLPSRGASNRVTPASATPNQTPPGIPPTLPPGIATPPAGNANDDQVPAGMVAVGGRTNGAASSKGTNVLNEDEVFPAGLIRFQDADVLQVLQLYQELTGRTVLRPANLPAVKVTIQSQTELTRREAIQALDSILSMNGIAMAPQGDKFVKAIMEAQLGSVGMRFSTNDVENLPESGTPISQVVRMTNALPSDVAKACQPFARAPSSLLAIDAANVLIIRDYAENVKRIMEVIAKVDVVPVDNITSVVIPIKYALASDIAQVLSSLAGGGSVNSVGRQTTRTGLTGSSFGGSGSGGGANGMGNTLGGMNPNNPNQMGNTSGIGTGGMSSSSAGRSSFASQLSKIVNRAASGDIVVLGNTKIIADERTNSLLIFASQQDLVQVSNIIKQLDVVLAQVLIEALIFEVSLNNTLDYGLSYLQKQPASSGNFAGIGALLNKPNPGTFLSPENFASSGSNGTANLPGGFSYLARFGKDLDVTATAIAGDSRFNVLSRPRIQTSHAVEANLFVGRTRPYPTGTSYGYGYGGGSYSQIQQLQIGITLSVLPLINPDGLVVMDIRQRTQSVGNEIAIANVGNVPETIDREANAKVAVRDRETIILGGFISNEKKKSASGIPILKDIPILGNLFRSTSKSEDRQELMILIRPTVLPTPDAAAEVVREEKGNMPGISRAEKDFRADEAKRRKAEAKVDAKELYKREGFSE